MPGAPERPDLLGWTSISVLARELYLNHRRVPAVPEVTLVSSQRRDEARFAGTTVAKARGAGGQKKKPG